jgi:hypothetical protein
MGMDHRVADSARRRHRLARASGHPFRPGGLEPETLTTPTAHEPWMGIRIRVEVRLVKAAASTFQGHHCQAVPAIVAQTMVVNDGCPD